MGAPVLASPQAAAKPRGLARVRAAAAAAGAVVLGAAPHVLHHVGPLAGAALLAGATGKLLFGALGLLLALPLLRRLRRRTSSGAWLSRAAGCSSVARQTGCGGACGCVPAVARAPVRTTGVRLRPIRACASRAGRVARGR